MKIRHFLFFFNFHWFFFFSSSFLSFSDARLCELFFFPLSIFLAFAIPSPTHACHRRSGGSSLISGAAKNRGRTREAERESLLLQWWGNSELKCLWFHCLFSKLKSCLPLFEQWVSEAWSASSLWFSTCREGRCLHLSKVLLLLGVVFPSFFFLYLAATTAGDQTLFGQCNVQMSSFDAISSVNMCCIGCL